MCESYRLQSCKELFVEPKVCFVGLRSRLYTSLGGGFIISCMFGIQMSEFSPLQYGLMDLS